MTGPKPGEEIPESIYKAAEQQAKSSGTYKSLSRSGARFALASFDRPIHDGFMMQRTDGQLIGYGWTNYQRGVTPDYRYYYIGPVKDDPKMNGDYYYFDCMNAFVNEGYFPADQFEDDGEAIETGADYEADVYKVRFDDGELIASRHIYSPCGRIYDEE